MIRKSIVLLLLLWLPWFVVIAQPTFKTGEFRFRVFSPTGEMLIQNKNASVKVDWFDKSATPPGPFIKTFIGQFESGYFYYQPMMSPAGGIIAPDIYFQIVYQQDTMRLVGINKFNREMAIIDSVPFLAGNYYLDYSFLPLLNVLPSKQHSICEFSWADFKKPVIAPLANTFSPVFLWAKEDEAFGTLLENVQNESTYNVMNNADKLQILDGSGEVVITNLSAATTVYTYVHDNKEILAFDLADFSKNKTNVLLLKTTAEPCFGLWQLPQNFQPHLIFYHENEWLSLATCKLKNDVLQEVTGIFKLTSVGHSLQAADSALKANVTSFFADSITALILKKKAAEDAAWQQLVDTLTRAQLSNSKANPKFFDKPVKLILANTDTFATLTLIDSVFTLTVYRSNSDLANMGFAVRKIYSGKYSLEGNYITVSFEENARLNTRLFYMIATKKQLTLIDRNTKRSLLFNRVKQLY